MGLHVCLPGMDGLTALEAILTDDANLDAYGLDRKQLVDTLVQCSLRQILENGFFHGE